MKWIGVLKAFIPKESTLKEGQKGLEFAFSDDIGLGLFIDFKRENRDNVNRLLATVNKCPYVKELSVGGSPNPYFTDQLFAMIKVNETITKLDVALEMIPHTSYNILEEAL